MSTFGILHTLVSVLPVGFGLVAFARLGRIDPRTRLGRLYLITMFAGTVSSFGFLVTRGFNPAQVLTLITLATLLVGLFTFRGGWRTDGIVQRIAFSTSYFLLWFFTTTETLTRLPKGMPIASGPNDPALIPVRLGLLLILAVGIAWQVRSLRASRTQPAI